MNTPEHQVNLIKSAWSKIFQTDTLSFNNSLAGYFNVEPALFTDWHWQQKNQIKTLGGAEALIHLSPEEKAGFQGLGSIFKVGISPYYVAVMRYLQDRGIDNMALKIQSLPNCREQLDELEEGDPLLEESQSPTPDLIHIYRDRVAFCVSNQCPMYCRYCFRKRRGEKNHSHYDWDQIEKALSYIRQTPAIRDVLVTGGDPLMADDQTIDRLLDMIRGIPHIEILRIGTRVPVTLPYRITDSLCSILKKYHPLWINTQFNCSEEVTPAAEMAIAKLAAVGIPLGNQSVFLKGVNDSPAKLFSLLKDLVKIRVRPYYIFHPHTVTGTRHLRPSVKEGLALMGKLRGNISGLAIPIYILDTPSGKIPLQSTSILGVDGNDLILETSRGEIWREKGVWG